LIEEREQMNGVSRKAEEARASADRAIERRDRKIARLELDLMRLREALRVIEAETYNEDGLAWRYIHGIAAKALSEQTATAMLSQREKP
jgi:hypothetical protein